MPRSFLVKKYFSNKKPYYRESQLESQTGKFLSFTELNALVIRFDKFKPRQELISQPWVPHQVTFKSRTDPYGRQTSVVNQLENVLMEKRSCVEFRL